MKSFPVAALTGLVTAALLAPARADEKEAQAVIDKAIKAMGGEEKLAGIKAFSIKGKGTIVIKGDEIAFTFESKAKGLGQYRSTYQGEVGGEKFTGGIVLDGDKGWRMQNADVTKLEGEALANEKRNVYLEVVPILVVPLKGKEFKLDTSADETVDGKPAAVVRVTGPDSKDFKLYFDKESGLPVRLNGQVVDGEGQRFTQETTFEDYKDFNGIKVATRSRTKKDGERYVDVEGVELKALDDVEPTTFAEPK